MPDQTGLFEAGPVGPDWTRRDAAPQFDHPWEARAFALVVNLAEAGHFTWPEWVGYLSRSIAGSDDRDGRAMTYAEHWIDAAESLLIAKGITSAEQLRARRLGCWPIDLAHASRATPASADTRVSVAAPGAQTDEGRDPPTGCSRAAPSQ